MSMELTFWLGFAFGAAGATVACIIIGCLLMWFDHLLGTPAETREQPY